MLCSTHLQVPFLNLMGLLAERAGSVHVRVGGNTQESAALVPSLPNNKILEKEEVNVNDPVRRHKIATRAQRCLVHPTGIRANMRPCS